MTVSRLLEVPEVDFGPDITDPGIKYKKEIHQQAVEAAHGALVVKPSKASVARLRPGEGVRMFTNGFSGCVGIGYVALLQTGERTAYLQHALYWDVRDAKVRIPLPRGQAVSEAKGVLLVHSLHLSEPFRATQADIPYKLFSTDDSLKPLVEATIDLCGDPSRTTIVPYNTEIDRGIYDRSLIVDVRSEDPLGVIIADGRHEI